MLSRPFFNELNKIFYRQVPRKPRLKIHLPEGKTFLHFSTPLTAPTQNYSVSGSLVGFPRRAT